MGWLEIALLVLIGAWIIAALIYMIRHKGGCGCSGDCEHCKNHRKNNCREKKG